ncbi:unnamed protein product [Chironomus riparius]|uniref:Uncharacterized protein n=1 Tax=Chironomus riparius TaxID=315576 RepID=A0A9N9RHP2_9DIPT|nr:unnamed protein product [Chironomus riparius]
MLNVPPKFNQICRLCLTLVEPKSTNDSDEIIKNLSIFNTNGQQASYKSSIDKKSNDNNFRDDDQLNKKAKRSNEISISLSGGNTSVVNNGFIDDDSDEDITERILECLSIKRDRAHIALCKYSKSAFGKEMSQEIC